MKIVAKKDRKLLLINTGNTQNENKTETIELTVPEEYEDYNKKIVFVTDDGIVWDIIQDNTYKLTKAITKYKQVDFYIWLTKGDVDFRSKTMPLRFYHNVDASDEITDEEIHGVNTVVNLLEEEIEKVDSLETELRDLITDIQNKLDNGEFDGEDGYTPQKGVDYFTEQDIEEIEGDILNEVYTKSETDALLQEKADLEDIPDVSNFITKDVNNLTNYTLKTNTGSLIDLEINDTTYVVTLKLKSQDGTVISTDTIDLPLESVVVSGRYDNTTKKVILTLENGSEVDFSVADLVAGLQTEITSQNKLASDLVDDTNSGNKFVTTSEKQTWNNKLDESDLTDYVKNTDYASSSKGGVLKTNTFYSTATQSDGNIRADVVTYNGYQSKSEYSFIGKGTLENVITGKQLINQTQLEESQETQDEQIEALQTENARLKATLPTTTGEGQDITLDKTAELEFIKPPLPMGNSEQDSTTGKNLFDKETMIQNGYINLNGVISILNATKTCVIPCEANKTYTISKISTNKFRVGYLVDNYGSEVNVYGLIQKTIETNITITTGENAKYLVAFVYDSSMDTSITLQALLDSVQCELGSTATSYEPYTNGASPNPDYPQEITNVTGDVEVKVQNKNIVKIDNVEQTTINGITYSIQNGILTINGTANNGTSIILANNISLKQGTYTHSINDIKSGMYFSYDNINNTMLRVVSGTKEKSKTFQLAENTIYNRYILWIDNGTSFNNEKFYLQTEKNSTATEWNTHKEQAFTFPLGNEKLMLGDYLADDGIHHVKKQLILDGSESWGGNGDNENYGQYVLTINDKKYGELNIISNKFISLVAISANCIAGRNANKNIYISIKKSIVPYNTSSFKTWLETQYNNNTPVIVEYELDEETITPYTSAQQTVYNAIKEAISYEEQTNISGSSSGSNPKFSVKAYQNTKLVLQDISNAIVALGGV